ncbi:hypothetical protein HFU84_04250 [Acidithiobacillus sp. CV18-2]|uniref:Uncharacterized protein n=1 Tax=Igneacidithiobacillus copahuensis TaxID=2724909 RepID=A0AAE3CKH0_9PROT|nr:hypothetical protein [Igneacidithiobacillus copahuensis]MBU2754773.1 hypothetical protein [Acidithiobacillus sp. CV18-3]MBU2758393.1 hypothetical protein [Acidithiobacillus sp. BN09-2]MBU2776727.1 hypothetical protein [Acidithiobacillus sp. CV18-2]MBU2795444.1 hypothetical protein [Acidithiobacillus sp. VAN18-2]MBU2799020.1 hypothetical protein [Acidithiobacillus sp. VAN18-4]UTV81568.1 hypothetical protein MQE22_02810 [Acidithiobacillus sp. YTS05]
MKTIPIADVSTLKNELNKYKKGKKLEIPRFNQLARMGYLGRLIMTPLDPEDPACKSYLVHIQEPQGLAAHFIELDEDLIDAILILDGEQAMAIAAIMQQGVQDRARWHEELNERDFYFSSFYRPKERAE